MANFSRSAFCLLAMFVITATSGQSYPSKPVRIVTSGIGGAGDIASRLVAQGLTNSFGQQVIVDNRGIVAVDMVAKAPADGYTLILYANPLWLTPFMRDNVSYDPIRDFAPISLVGSTPNILVVHPSLPVKSTRDLIAIARAKPGQLNYVSTSSGSSTHLSAELFKSMAGVDIVRINYKGTGPALADLIAGNVEMMFSTAASVSPHISSGRLRALAVTSSRPSALAPNLPTVASSGLRGYESGSVLGIFAPARTPHPIIVRLNQQIAGILHRPDVKQHFFDMGVEAVGSTPEEFAATVKNRKWRGGATSSRKPAFVTSS